MEMDDGEGSTLWMYLISPNFTLKMADDKFYVYFATNLRIREKKNGLQMTQACQQNAVF